MNNVNDKELDSLFQEGAELQEFEYNPDSWKLMEEQLVKRDRKIFFFRWTAGILALSILAFIMFYTSNGTWDQKDISGVFKLSTKGPELVKQGGREICMDQHLVIDSNKLIRQGNEARFTNQKFDTEHNIGMNNEMISEGVSNAKNAPSRDVVTKLIIENADEGRDVTLISDDVILAKKEELLVTNDEITRNEIVTGFIPPILNPVINTNGSLNLIIPKYSKIVNIKSKNPFDFNITLSAHPEWSSVGLFSQQNRGWKVGTNIGVQFNNHFQIGFGVAVSQKIYEARGENYIPIGGWIDDIKPMWMNAKCTIFEIPLELGYYLSKYENDGFFATVGFSSYILNSEWYGFSYDEEAIDPEVFTSLVKEINPEEIEKKHHIAGVGRLSFGYHHRLSSRVALEMSPYVEIPLTGIGEGNVNLYSTGVKLGLKFQ